ncbi:MAG: Holliday junction branch migration protein RuvA [Bacteroidota bacterium]
MITYVSGTLAHKKPTDAVIDIQGLGYALLIPTSTYERLPKVGEATKLLTHFHVREDQQVLFGFATEAERMAFKMLIAVSGVGPKLALAALSAMSPSELRDRVIDGDAAFLQRIPGVGRKTAERLVVDLRDRFAKADLPTEGGSLGGGSDARAAARADALAALEALGLSRAAGEKALRKVLRAHPGAHSADELVRLALREAM